MCVSIADCTWLSGRLDTHDGNWLCHTRLCPRTRILCAFANETIVSPGLRLKLPLDGSVVSHFISLPGVTMSNCCPARFAIVAFDGILPVTSVPMYRPCASARVRNGVPAAAAAVTEPSAANDATPAARIPVTAPAASPRYVLQGRGAVALAANRCTARHAFISPPPKLIEKFAAAQPENGGVSRPRRAQAACPADLRAAALKSSACRVPLPAPAQRSESPALRQVPAEVIDHFTRVVLGPIDERGLAPAQHG